MIVYFQVSETQKWCVMSGKHGDVTKWGRAADVSPCYLCPVKKCTRYPDGLVRAECNEETFEYIRQKRCIEIKKVIKE